jgi:hypothetical protein
LPESGFVVIYVEIESVCTIQTGWFLNWIKKALFDRNRFCPVNWLSGKHLGSQYINYNDAVKTGPFS